MLTLKEKAVHQYLGVANCTEAAFEDDFYIAQRLLIQIRKDGQSGKQSNIPLCVNYVITFFNVFKHAAAIEILTTLAKQNELPKVNAFLVFLNKIPRTTEVDVDETLLGILIEHYGNVLG